LAEKPSDLAGLVVVTKVELSLRMHRHVREIMADE
jgi:hypothetical protein